MRRLIALIFLFTLFTFSGTAYAIVDPLSSPNNKFGIHLIQATPSESSPAAELVNTNGDWGYITVLIESKDRKADKWQEFFNDLRKRHLIPIVRLAAEPENSHWKRPAGGEEQEWANFLDKLNWPIKNRYIIIYNEPNHAAEWGGAIDAKNYAQVLDKTITALKNKNDDFFVLNAGFDASSPSKPPMYEDQALFLRQMNEEIPGIFERLDGWVSHSYPNPEFSGSPNASGRGTIRSWFWELQFLRQLGVTKNLPIFITETGWKHSDGINHNSNLYSPDEVADNFKIAFGQAWNSDRIVAVTPFLLSYQESPFDHFSFKKNGGSEYHPHFHLIKNLPKTAGKPQQENKAELIKGEIFSSLSAGQNYEIYLTVKNTGQSIWNSTNTVKLAALAGGDLFAIEDQKIPQNIKIEPGGEYTFKFIISTPNLGGVQKIILNLFADDKEFDSPPLIFTPTIKAPVILKVKANLKWKSSSEGSYILKIKGSIEEIVKSIDIASDGISEEFEARYLLPDYSFTLTLEKPYYKYGQITKSLNSGVNVLDFGILEPDLLSAFVDPREFWKLLPLSN